MQKHPPFLLHFLAMFFMVSFLINLNGIVQLVQSWNWLLAAGYTPHPVYVVFKSTFIGLASLFAAASLWLYIPFSARFSQILAVIVFIWFWLDRLLLTRNPLSFEHHAFPLLISLLILLFVVVSSWLLEPYMKYRANRLSPADEDGEQDEQNLP